MKRFLIALAALALGSASAIAGNYSFDGNVQVNGGTATAAANAASLDNKAGVITTEALTTAGLASYTLTITNSVVADTDICLSSLYNGTNSQGTPTLRTVAPGTGSLVIVIANAHASQALNGTLKISFVCFKN